MKNFKKRILTILLSILMLLSTVIIPVMASNEVLSDIDIVELRLDTSVPRKIFDSSKSWVNLNMGEFSLVNLYDENTYIKEFRYLSFGIFTLLFLWEIMKVLLGEKTIQQLFIDLIKVLVWMPLITAIMVAGVYIANSIIRSLLIQDDFVTYVNKNIYKFVLNAEEVQNQQNLFQSAWSNVTTLVAKINPIVAIAGAVSAQGQYKTAVRFISWGYIMVAYFNWFSMFIVDFTLKLLFMFSPVIAVMNILGQSNVFTKKFWSFYWDCLLAKVSFFLIFRLIVDEINKQTITSQVNIGFAVYCLCLFLAMSALVFIIREIFKVENLTSLIRPEKPLHQIVSNIGSSSLNTTVQASGSLRRLRDNMRSSSPK